MSKKGSSAANSLYPALDMSTSLPVVMVVPLNYEGLDGRSVEAGVAKAGDEPVFVPHGKGGWGAVGVAERRQAALFGAAVVPEVAFFFAGDDEPDAERAADVTDGDGAIQ